METSFQAIQRLLKEAQTKNKNQDNLQAFNLLVKLLKNIIDRPQEDKFRSIKTSNKTLQQKLFNIPEIKQLLESLKFQYMDDAYIYLESEVTTLQIAMPMINQTIQELEYQNMSPEEKKKFDEVHKRQQELNAQFKKEQEEKARLANLNKLDKKEKQQEEKAKDSYSNQVRYGANMSNFKAIGVDLCNQKGG